MSWIGGPFGTAAGAPKRGSDPEALPILVARLCSRWCRSWASSELLLSGFDPRQLPRLVVVFGRVWLKHFAGLLCGCRAGCVVVRWKGNMLEATGPLPCPGGCVPSSKSNNDCQEKLFVGPPLQDDEAITMNDAFRFLCFDGDLFVSVCTAWALSRCFDGSALSGQSIRCLLHITLWLLCQEPRARPCLLLISIAAVSRPLCARDP